MERARETSEQECGICRQEVTSTHVEVQQGTRIYVCVQCLEKAKDNFIWVCINCGASYFRPKKVVLKKLRGMGIEKASVLCEGVQLIQGIDMCVACNPDAAEEYLREASSVAGMKPFP